MNEKEIKPQDKLDKSNQKTISLTLNWELWDFFIYKKLVQQGDFYFGKGNWYATQIYTQRRKEDGAITYLMEIEGK